MFPARTILKKSSSNSWRKSNANVFRTAGCRLRSGRARTRIALNIIWHSIKFSAWIFLRRTCTSPKRNTTRRLRRNTERRSTAVCARQKPIGFFGAPRSTKKATTRKKSFRRCATFFPTGPNAIRSPIGTTWTPPRQKNSETAL